MVFGQFGNTSPAAAASFREAMENPSKVGMTFGGGCFFGRGIHTSGGTVKFKVSSYTASGNGDR